MQPPILSCLSMNFILHLVILLYVCRPHIHVLKYPLRVIYGKFIGLGPNPMYNVYVEGLMFESHESRPWWWTSLM